jgi:hypothetical protein
MAEGTFSCFIPGSPLIGASAFQAVGQNRWCLTLNSERPVDELAVFVREPLPADSALAIHIAAPPFDVETSWHYLGALSNGSPTALYKTRYVWSARDAVPTTVQVGVEMQPLAQAQQRPPEKVSAEVLEAGRRIGQDLYHYITSFAQTVTSMEGRAIQLPSNVLERWLGRFNDKCRAQGLDWLSAG